MHAYFAFSTVTNRCDRSPVIHLQVHASNYQTIKTYRTWCTCDDKSIRSDMRTLVYVNDRCSFISGHVEHSKATATRKLYYNG